jgi:hypothetical protein
MDSRSPSLLYDNNIVRCKAIRNIPEVVIVGYRLDEVEEGREFNTYFWIARHLIKNRLIELVDETISTNEWTQIHFKERINPAGPPGPLPDDFYKKAYQSFISARERDEPSNMMNRMRARFRDILASRINRITRQAAAHADSPTRVLQESESTLYAEVHRIVSEWRDSMLEIGEV